MKGLVYEVNGAALSWSTAAARWLSSDCGCSALLERADQLGFQVQRDNEQAGVHIVSVSVSDTQTSSFRPVAFKGSTRLVEN